MKSIIFTIFCFTSIVLQAQNTSASGLYNRTSVGVVAGTNSNLSVASSNGFRLKNGWENGFGFGVERYYGIFTAPVFVESRVNFLRNKIEGTEFFTGVMGGYQSILGNNRKGEGYTGGISIGMTHYLSKHASIYTCLGYRYVWLKSDPYYYYPYMTMDVYYNPDYYETSELSRVELRIGFCFN